MKDFELSITICSWNAKDDLRTCLQALRECRGEANFEVIVVDNNSEDGSPDMVAAEFPEFRLERQAVNLGFTGGHNLAYGLRRGDHVLCLNSDAFVHPGAIRTCMEYLNGNPDVGVIGPQLLNGDGSLQFSCRRFPNPVAALFRNTPLGKLFPNNRFTRDYLMTDFDHTAVKEVDWVSGAAFFARGSLLDELKGFDPSYFMFCEDVDFCWRVWERGSKVVYLPTAVVTHLIGRSTDKAPNRMIARFHKSMLHFYRTRYIPRLNPILRPGALAVAAFGLGARASLFYIKNKMDIIKRALQR